MEQHSVAVAHLQRDDLPRHGDGKYCTASRPPALDVRVVREQQASRATSREGHHIASRVSDTMQGSIRRMMHACLDGGYCLSNSIYQTSYPYSVSLQMHMMHIMVSSRLTFL